MMNLPTSVLGLIPWICNFLDSPQGSKPKDYEDWFWAPFKAIGAVFVGVFIVIGMAFATIFLMIVEFFVEIFMDILPILQYILWLIICTIILVLIYIIFAITLITIILGFVTIIPFLIFYSILINGQLEIKLNSLTIQNENNFATFKYIIGLEEVDFFAFVVPTLYIYYITQNTSFNMPINFFTSSIALPSNDVFEDIYGINSSSIHQNSGLPMSSDMSNEELANEQFLKGLFGSIAIFGAILAITGVLINGIEGWGEIILAIISVFAFMISTSFFLIYAIKTNFLTKSFINGLIVATIINLIVVILLLSSSYTPPDPLAYLFLIFSTSVIDVISLLEDLETFISFDFDEFRKPEHFFSVMALVTGFISFLDAPPDDRLGSLVLFIAILGILLYCFIFLPVFVNVDPY